MSSRRSLLLLLACLGAAPLAWLAAAQNAPNPKAIEWRTDYNQALVESEKRGLPIVIDFTMTPCFFCEKLEATTFRDPRVVGLMNQSFIPLKIHKERDGRLCNEMQISAFPTLVIAGPGRKILKMHEGYLDAGEFQELLQKYVVQVAATPPDWMKQQFDQAQKAYQDGEYARACAALKNILDDGKNQSLQAPALKLLANIEAKANERVTQAKELAAGGKTTEAVQALTDTLVTFPGLGAAKEAGEMLTRLAQSNEDRSKQRGRRAAELIAQAREYYKTKEIVPCLDRCETLLASYGDLPEGIEASQLVQEIKGNPEWLQLASDTLTDRLAAVWLALADNMIKRARPREAEIFLRRVIQAFPGTRYAESAQIRIGQLQGIPPSRVDVSSAPE
jgi:thioredoxin-related protein